MLSHYLYNEGYFRGKEYVLKTKPLKLNNPNLTKLAGYLYSSHLPQPISSTSIPICLGDTYGNCQTTSTS